MGTVEVVVLGLALSMDAFAVTISNTFVCGHEGKRRLLLMPLLFGLFQAGIPVLGYLLGGLAAWLIEAYAGVVSLVILGVIGVSMLHEGISSLRADEETAGEESDKRRLTLPQLALQAVATSIDAFAVGISLRAAAVNLAFAVSVIGVTTAVCCVVGLVIGRRLGQLLGDYAELLGGVILIAIGVRVFLGL